MHSVCSKAFLAAVLIVFCGCSKISLQGTGTIIRPIAGSYGTKGAITTTEGLQSKGVFHILAYNDAGYTDNETGGKTSAGLYFDADAKYSSGAWSIEGSPKWLNGVNLSFWMYAPKTVNGTRSITAPGVGASSMSFTFTVASDVSQQDDLLFAHNSVFFVQGVGLAEIAARIELIVPDVLSLPSFVKEEDDCPDTGTSEHAAWQVKNRVEVSIFKKHLAELNSIRVTEEGVLITIPARPPALSIFTKCCMNI